MHINVIRMTKQIDIRPFSCPQNVVNRKTIKCHNRNEDTKLTFLTGGPQ